MARGSLTAAELRESFDRAFSLPPREALQDVVDLLTLHVGGEPYAIRLRDLSGVVVGRRVVPVPAGAPHLLGLAGVRGSLVPVFGLASLLGYAQPLEAPRCMVLCGGEERLGLAFSDFESCLRLPSTSVCADDTPHAARQYVQQVARTRAGAHAVISIPLVVSALRGQSGEPRLTKER